MEFYPSIRFQRARCHATFSAGVIFEKSGNALLVATGFVGCWEEGTAFGVAAGAGVFAEAACEV